ncbi:DUF1003 domain-containing protein, partial [Candidatus Bipolaricaulota bacterium]|nr:DUF1003 domain-containing protein [Candidatus Bipolaricaulota bacterium]
RQQTKLRCDLAHESLLGRAVWEVNLKAELEIMTLHEKLDVLRERQWAELVALSDTADKSA